MKAFANGISSIVLAAWAIAIAVFSVQNYTLISLNFLTFTSVPIPLGVLLAFCFAGGAVLGGVAPVFLGRRKAKQRLRSRREEGANRNDLPNNWIDE